MFLEKNNKHLKLIIEGFSEFNLRISIFINHKKSQSINLN